MIEDTIVNKIRQHRKDHAKKYGNDLDKIVVSLRKQQLKSDKNIVTLKPRLFNKKTA